VADITYVRLGQGFVYLEIVNLEAKFIGKLHDFFHYFARLAAVLTFECLGKIYDPHRIGQTAENLANIFLIAFF
jgi:hypothetical protein